MSYSLDEIKVIRKRLGLTQGQLASYANVSQSMIAKIESGLLDPAYSKATSIFEALDNLTKKQTAKISDIMLKKIISLKPDDSIGTAVLKMKKHEISQLPVVLNGIILGLVSETVFLDALTSGMDINTNIEKIMGDVPPTLSINADVDAAANLLKYYPLILIQDKGKLKGIVTKADIISSMFKK